jgi:hypothetical protein
LDGSGTPTDHPMITRGGMTHTHTYALLEVSQATHDDILARLERVGPDYIREYVHESPFDGKVIVLGDVGLVVEKK